MAFLIPGLRRNAAIVLLTAALAAARPAPAQQETEEAIKAAFLYNFTKFIDWPDTAFEAPSSPFNVCVFADAIFRRELHTILQNEQVRGRSIRVTEYNNGDDLKGCQVVYFGAQHTDRFVRRTSSLKQAPVLTVGEGARFLQQGGMIAFMVEQNRVRFDISKRGADAVGLTVSSKLLRVARQIHGASPP